MKVSRGASQALAQQAKAENKGINKKTMNSKMGMLGAKPADSAQVSLSNKAQQIKKATNLAKADSVDEKKVAYFQNLIDGGKYNVDSAKVADKLIDEHMKMPT